MRLPNDRSCESSDFPHEDRLAFLGRIAAHAAHDLNNQLMVALAKLEMAMDAPHIAEQSLEQATAAILRAADLTGKMLGFARKNCGEDVVFDLAGGLRSDETFLKLAVPSRVEFRVDVPDASLGVFGNPARLQQMMLNLILNAVEAIGDRRGNVLVSLRSDEPGWIDLEVQDDGCGMDEASVARIYEPFWTTKPFGRGLGMSTVLETVRDFGGEIEVRSQVGVGTRFRIRLPRIAEFQPASGSERVRKPWARTNKGGKILVVEDDPFVRQVVATFLGRAGHTPFTAPNSVTADDLLHDVGGFWLALVDVSLGGDDGICLMEAIRRSSPGTLVVLISGYPRESVLDGAGPAPDGFLMKPFQSADLEAELERLSALFRERTQGGPSPEVPPPFGARRSPGPSSTS